ncbi:hypothetical protein ONZ45_g1486 [Pleurotus djamor]|nr:hypothetical protein ONZ45_g1486 [Pleurotus djamor]
MGATQSYIPPEAAFTTVAVAGAIAFGYLQTKGAAQPGSGTSEADKPSADAEGSGSGKKGKKKKRVGGGGSERTVSGSVDALKPNVVAFPEVIPGQFDSGSIAAKPPATTEVGEPKPKKNKKKSKKGKAKPTLTATSNNNDSAVPGGVSPSSENRSVDSSEDEDGGGSGMKALGLHQSRTPVSQPRPSPPLSRPHKQSTTSIETDSSWTRVETRRGKRRNPENPQPASIITTGETYPVTSDAGATSVTTTGTSSPIAERGMELGVGGEIGEEEEDEGVPFLASIARERPSENRKTLAEKLLPKPRKTGVDDMTETPDYPTVARVMRVQPRPDEKPASGFSWGDYEDVDASGPGENDADGEDDGWGVVRRSRPKRQPQADSSVSATTPAKSPETMTKRQRQNANRREAEKAGKEAAEADRLARLAKHKSELERTRMKEQIAARK